MEIPNSGGVRSVGEPPANLVGERRLCAATEDRYMRYGFRNNTCDHFRNKNNPQHVQTAADITGQKFGCPMFC
jgi:hypothetical protein